MNNILSDIKANLEVIKKRMDLAAHRAGRDSNKIQLVTVTKSHPVEIVEAAINAGADKLGENYPEEAVIKIELLKEISAKVQWHMIGHVQSRKVRLVVENFNYVHSIDSFRLAEKFNRTLEDYGITLPIFLEVNVSGEDTKNGFPINTPEGLIQTYSQIEQIIDLRKIKVIGLMSMPPYTIDPEKSRPYFKRMQWFRDELLKKYNSLELDELSMGTSSDFEVAIEEGATIIRVGQAILGPRIKE